MIRVGIIGAKGYSAGEAMRWLSGHPEVDLSCLMARVESPEPAAKYFPDLRGVVEAPIEPMNLDALAGRCDAAFLCLPHTAAQEIAAQLVRAGVKAIDVSADFRFDSVALYEQTYKVKHLAPELNARFPYSQPELFGAEIPGAPGLACPGCYPTATLLGLAPLVAEPSRFDLGHIVVNAASGVSGAGRKAEERYLFCEVNESFAAYSVGNHRHRPEIEEKLARLAGREVRITFTTHLAPMNRGILATTTVPMRAAMTTAELCDLIREYYKEKPFVRVLPPGQTPITSAVEKTNFCDIGAVADSHSGAAIVISAIDNLAKGASSQAVQAMNILYGLPETLGLLPQAHRKAAV